MTVLVALIFVAAALRGYLPGAEAESRAAEAPSTWAGVVVVVLLGASIAVVAAAVVLRLRDRTSTAPTVASRPDWLRGDRGRPTWRISLIAFGFLLGWLLLYVLLSRLGGGPADAPAGVPGTTPDGTSGSRQAVDAGVDQPPDVGGDSPLLGYFTAATVVFLVVLVAGTIVASRRRHRPGMPAAPHVEGRPEPDDGSEPESLVRAAEVGLAAVNDPSREPRSAIIACYAAMERELSLLPDAAPRDFDTASEVLARAVDHRALRPDSATQLVDLFDEARFSPHVMNEGHRDAAVDVLTRVLGELRSHA